MLDYQIKSSKEALLLYAFKTKKYDAINGKMMFIQGSPLLTKHSKINTGGCLELLQITFHSF